MAENVSYADIAVAVGGRLKMLREKRDLTQVMLSARLQAAGMERGSSAKTISSWERGETPLPLPALLPLAIALRMEPDSLGRQLGLCGDPEGREILVAEGADLLEALANEPPEISNTILRWLRESVEIARLGRLGRTN